MNKSEKIAFVTGVSGGIGLALTETLLKNNFRVFGIGRKNAIEHPNYSFISLDLSDSPAVAKFQFPDADAGSYLLINNAGVLGEVLPVGEHQPGNFLHVMTVNTISPQVLINQFTRQFYSEKKRLHVLNISSGAGKHAIDAWAAYCASKAALDLFSETVKLEMDLRDRNNFFIHSVAPGVVDTRMQAQIRSVSPEKFKASQRFHDLKNNGELVAPEYVAERLLSLIKDPAKYANNILALTDIT